MHNKKIGIITFHWATNYGAVLQSFALQRYLREKGYFVEIINYKPLRVILIQWLVKLKKIDLLFFYKEFLFKLFRSRYLKCSEQVFFNNHSLLKISSQYDTYICGSDQIWNTSFLNGAEGHTKKVLSYFLDFVDPTKKRIAYAASFGVEMLDKYNQTILLDPLSKFAAIGVRENTGQDIVSKLGLESKVVLDPTCLFRGEDYVNFFNLKVKKDKRICSYILHEHDLSKQIVAYYKSNHNKIYQINQTCGLKGWLSEIMNSEYLITNSFHGVVFAILFHVPFIVALVEGSGMNDRLMTLLSSLRLHDRIVYNYNEVDFDILYHNTNAINWDFVEKLLEELRSESIRFLISNIS